MAVGWLNNFFIPLLKALVLIVFFGGISIFLFYHIRKLYKLRLKWFLKYYLFGRDFDADVMAYCIECIDSDMSYYDVKMRLLLQSMPADEINDIMYVYKKLCKEMKGGINYGRGTKRYNFKDTQGKRSSRAGSNTTATG